MDLLLTPPPPLHTQHPLKFRFEAHRFHIEVPALTVNQLRTQREEMLAQRDEAQNQIEALRSEVDDIKRQLGI